MPAAEHRAIKQLRSGSMSNSVLSDRARAFDDVEQHCSFILNYVALCGGKNYEAETAGNGTIFSLQPTDANSINFLLNMRIRMIMMMV